MPYASGRVIHDADAHIMELPGFLAEHLEAKHHAAVTDAVESFCAVRRPRNSERVAGQPGAPAKQAPAAGAPQRATAKMR